MVSEDIVPKLCLLDSWFYLVREDHSSRMILLTVSPDLPDLFQPPVERGIQSSRPLPLLLRTVTVRESSFHSLFRPT